jgi:hypothetical protein
VPQFAGRSSFEALLAESCEFALEQLATLFKASCEHGEGSNRATFAERSHFAAGDTRNQIAEVTSAIRGIAKEQPGAAAPWTSLDDRATLVTLSPGSAALIADEDVRHHFAA